MITYRFEPDPEAKIALVCSPFAGVETPSLQLGILSSILRRDGIPTDVIYLNILFAELCHPLIYREAWEKSGQFAEGVFSPILHPDSRRGDILQRLCSEPGAGELALQWLALANRQIHPFVEECLGRVPWERYRVVGFSTSINQLVPALAISRVLKERYPRLKMVLGGSHCEGEMGEALLDHFPWLDYVYEGDAEIHITAVADSLLNEGPVRPVPGLLSRNSRASGESVDAREPFSDWGSIPPPDYSDYFEQLSTASFLGEVQVKIPFEGSRGCWWGAKNQCTFCGASPSQIAFRRKAEKVIIDELTLQSDRYGVRLFDAVDDSLDVKAFESLIPKLAEQRKERRLSFFFEVRCDLGREQVAALQAAGVDTVQPGIESFSTRILGLMKKGSTGIQNVQFLKWLATYGIRSLWNLLCGIPGEQDADYVEMAGLFPLLVHLDPPGSFQAIELRRFSPYFTNPEEHGVRITGPGKAYKTLFDLEEDALARLAYSFEYDTDRSVISGRSWETVDRAVVRWQRLHKPGSLSCSLEGGRVRILDERPGMPQDEVLLEPLASALYRLCDRVEAVNRIISRLKSIPALGLDAGEAEVAALLEELLAKGWMMREGDKYLALAVPVGEDASKWPPAP